MLHLLGRGQEPEWDEDKHDIDEVFAFPVSYTHLRAHETVLDIVCLRCLFNFSR